MRLKLNPDNQFVIEMQNKLIETNGYCPCAVVRNDDSKCMCKVFREMEEGTCPCGLWIKEKEEPNAESK